MLNKIDAFVGSLKTPYILRGVKSELRRSRVWLRNNQDKDTLFSLTALTVICLLAVSVLYSRGGYHAGFHSINYLANMLPPNVWQKVTFVGDAGMALCLFLFVARRSPATIWVVSIATVLGIFVSRGLKVYFGTLRPPAVLAEEQFLLIGKGFEHYSFPSGHALTVAILVSVLFYFSKTTGTRAWLIAFGFVVAFSRVVVGVHWPIDVLAGIALGVAITIGSVFLAKRWSWGFTRIAHFFAVGFMLICTVYLFCYSGGYPQASEFAKIIAASALVFFVKDYLLISHSNIRLRRRRIRRIAYGES